MDSTFQVLVRRYAKRAIVGAQDVCFEARSARSRVTLGARIVYNYRLPHQAFGYREPADLSRAGQ